MTTTSSSRNFEQATLDRAVSAQVRNAQGRLDDLRDRRVRKPEAGAELRGYPARFAPARRRRDAGLARGRGGAPAASPSRSLSIGARDRLLVTGPNGAGEVDDARDARRDASPRSSGSVLRRKGLRVALLEQDVRFTRAGAHRIRHVRGCGGRATRGVGATLRPRPIHGRDLHRPVRDLSIGQQRRPRPRPRSSPDRRTSSFSTSRPTTSSLGLATELEDALGGYPGASGRGEPRPLAPVAVGWADTLALTPGSNVCSNVVMRWSGQELTAEDQAALPRPRQSPQSGALGHDARVRRRYRFHEVLAKSALNRVPGPEPDAVRLDDQPVLRMYPWLCFLLWRGIPTPTSTSTPAHDFNAEIIVKVNVGEVLAKEPAKPSWRHEAVALGTNTDPYRHDEGRLPSSCSGIIAALPGSGTSVQHPQFSRNLLQGAISPLLVEAPSSVVPWSISR